MKRAALTAVVALILSMAVSAGADARKRPTRLRAFATCGQLVRYGVGHALRLPPFTRGPVPVPVTGGGESGGAVGDGSAPSAPAAGGDGAAEGEGTNVQEPGVDEPDIVKTDGRTLFAIAGGRTLRAVNVSGGEPRVLDELRLPEGESELLLHGDRLLVMVRTYQVQVVGVGEARLAVSLPYPGTTTLLEVDVSHPDALRIARTLTVDGQLVSSRLHDGTARLVLGSTPRALVPVIAPGIARAAAHRRHVSHRVRAWLPRGRFASRLSGRRWTRPLVGCRSVRRPTAFSGLSMLTVLTIDLDRGLWATDRTAIMSDADTVYASARSLYVATQRWTESGAPAATTAVHRFDASSHAATAYAASGEVTGHLLNQFSLSEQGDVLRLATTAGDLSESRVTTLAQHGTRLEELGHVGGLAHGERIYAVRFIGDAGYVVTFRQVDPLFTIDLSDPAHPAVRGELKVSGYSTYLHPVGAGRLLGVGREADAQGRAGGLQVSLFDVSDPAHPVRLAQHALGEQSSSQAEYDHHAFLWWPPGDLAVLPVSEWDGVSGEPLFDGSVGLHVRGSEITEAGRVEDGSSAGSSYVASRRAVVAGGALWTVSDRGVARADAGTLARTAWVPFG